MTKEKYNKSGSDQNTFQFSDVRKHTKIGDLIVDCKTGKTLVLDKQYYEAFCNKDIPSVRIYKRIDPDDPMYEEIKGFCKQEYDYYLQKKNIEKLEKAVDNSRLIVKELIKKQTNPIYVLYYYRKPNEKMSKTKILLRPGDRILNFGNRYNNQKYSLWVAILRTSGYTPIVNLKEFYCKVDHYNMLEGEAHSIVPIRFTNYKPGSEFRKSLKDKHTEPNKQ
jgi:hypothetical protein